MWTLANSGSATKTLVTAAIATSATAMAAARVPTRPSVPDAAIDPMLATTIDATSGITVMRMRLMKIVPTGVTIARSVAAAGEDAPASARPATRSETTTYTYGSVVLTPNSRVARNRVSAAAPATPALIPAIASTPT